MVDQFATTIAEYKRRLILCRGDQRRVALGVINGAYESNDVLS